jgi:chaperonin GroEL (HSP60 family)
LTNEQENKIIELLEKILKEITEIKENTKITADFATLRSEIINRTKGQQVNP